MGGSKRSSECLGALASVVVLALLVGQVHGCVFANRRLLGEVESLVGTVEDASKEGAAVVAGTVDDFPKSPVNPLVHPDSMPGNSTENLRRQLTIGSPSLQITCSLSTLSTLKFNQIDASETDPNEVWAIDTNKQVWKWQGGNSWYTPQANWFALSISVGKFGCYMVGLDNNLYKWSGSRFTAVGGPDAGWGAKWKWVSTGNQIWVVGAGDSRLFYKNDDDWTKQFTYSGFAANYVENSLDGEVWATNSGPGPITTTTQPPCYWACTLFIFCKWTCPGPVTTTTTGLKAGNSYRLNPSSNIFEQNGNSFQMASGSSGLYYSSPGQFGYWTGKEWQTLGSNNVDLNSGGYASSGASGFWITQSGGGVRNCKPIPNTPFAKPSPYQLEAFTDYPYNDINGLGSWPKSLVDCLSDCDKDSRCVVAVMDKIGGGGWCWLKYSLGSGKKTDNNRWSYRKTGQYLEGGVWKSASAQPAVCLPVENYKAFPRPALVYTPTMRHCFFNKVKSLVPTYRIKAADFLRLSFHDAGPLAADGSVMFNDERYHPNNKRLEGIEEIITIQRAVASCGFEPSFADVIQVATGVMQWASQPYPKDRDSMDLQYNTKFRLGRPDSTTDNGPQKLPGATMSARQLLDNFMSLFRITDVQAVKRLVLLSGAHTIGDATCATFKERLPRGAANVEPNFGAKNRLRCPGAAHECIKVELDTTTEPIFDNGYYKNLVQKKGLLTSDQNLYDGGEGRTRSLVDYYAGNNAAFLTDYITEFIAMGENGVTAPLYGAIS